MSLNTTPNNNNKVSFLLACTLLWLGSPASAFVPGAGRPANHNHHHRNLSTHSPQLLSDVLQIEWVAQSVLELQDLEATVTKTTTTPTASPDSVSLTMDYDLADAISEPRVDPATLQQRIQERLRKSNIQRQQQQAVDDELADAVSEPHINQAELQRRIQAKLRNHPQAAAAAAPAVTDDDDDEFADAVSEPHIDPATLQRRIQARLAAKKRTTKAPALTSAKRPTTVDVQF